jgi:hypothetical protein
MTCPLCLNINSEYYLHDKQRDYWQCNQCDLVFVKPNQYLSVIEEKAIYDTHQNNSNDPGYRKFLSKLSIPLVEKLSKGMLGLDFGSGPGPTLSIMLGELGFKVENYDIFYANNSKLLKQRYNFITCTEVIEHLHHPHRELTQISKLLDAKGMLGIMTKRVINKERFKTWHYKNDPTHVCFYSDKTFEFIAENWKYDLEFIQSDVVILTKR